jgi:hypothetical protein
MRIAPFRAALAVVSALVAIPAVAQVPSISVKDAAGVTQSVNSLPPGGQATKANSLPVTIANDQGALGTVGITGTLPAFAAPPGVAQSGTWDVNDISGTISLPTGAATSAAQATGNTSLSNIDAGIPAALGQTTKSASMPVTVASDQGQVQVGAEGVVSIVPTVTTSAYAANDVIGGVISMPVFRTAGGSGVLSELSVHFLGTSQTPELAVYIFEVNPNQAGTTTTDNGAVAFGNLDWTNLVDIYSITPATANGITKSFGAANMSVPVKNRDGTPTTNLYAVVVTKAAVTLAVGDLVVHARVSQD